MVAFIEPGGFSVVACMIAGVEDGPDPDGCVPVVDGTAAELAQAAAINISVEAERPIAIFFNMSYFPLI